MAILDIQHPEQAKPNRRWFLKLGVIGAAAVGTGGWWSWQRGVFTTDRGDAFDPWKTWNGGEKPRRLVGAAVLAASKHNTQPWQFRVEPDFIDVFIDSDRNVGTLDPLGQEAWISAGCALANLTTAAPAEELQANVRYVPDRELSNWVAQVELTPGRKIVSDLYEAIPHRHTNRYAYDPMKPIPQPALDALSQLAEQDCAAQVAWLTTLERRDAFGKLTIAATEAIINDFEQSSDGGRWYRSTWEQVKTQADGMTLDTSGLPIRARLADKLFVSPGPKDFDLIWLENTRKVHVVATPAFGIITVNDGTDPEQLVKAGMAWQRMHLWATASGFAMQPLTQTIERRNREVAGGVDSPFGRGLDQLADGRGVPVFAFRVGYPTLAATPSPRRPIDAVIAKPPARRPPEERQA